MDGLIAERQRRSPALRSAGMPGPGEASARAWAAALDLWLRQELTRLYGAALHEPVPDSLLRLIAGAPSGRSG